MDAAASSKVRPSARTLRMNSFGAEFARVRARAVAAGVAEDRVVLPAEGMLWTRDGLGLHYLEWPGPAAGPLLIFLHGGGLHAHSFDVVGLLARDFGRAVAVDLRGHGESDWAPAGGYGPAHLVADIDAVVGSFDTRPVVLVGHSLGGMAALMWAGRRPAELAALVVVDVGPRIDEAGGRSVGGMVAHRPLFADLDEAETFVAGSRSGPRDPATSGVAQNLSWTDDGLLTWKHDTTQFRPGTVPTPDEMRAAARRIACPTLVLRGARSRVFGDDGAAELAGLVPGGRWERVPDAGHTIQTSNPRGLVDVTARLLREHRLIPNRTSTSDEGVR